MGKAGRRKQNRQRQKQQLNSDPIAVTNGDASKNATIVNPNSAVHQLRHVDPKIRHSALVALQASVLSQLHCASNRPVSMKVLQAVREQVTSSDLECSAVAADCIAQYLAAVSSNQKSAHHNSEKHKQTTASWGLVLLGRLDDCRKALVEQQQQQSSQATMSKNQQKKAEKTKKHWYAVASPCFVALCHLIEDNGHALDQINLQKRTFVEVVFGMLSLESKRSPTTSLGGTTTDDTAMKDDEDEDDNTLQHDAIFEKLRETTALYAARCLHSALDDNWELAEALDGGDIQGLWKEFLGSNIEGEHTLCSTTRLHLIGCLVNLYQLSFYGGRTTSSPWQEEAIMEYGIQSSSGSEGLLLEVLLSSKQNQNPPATSLLQTRLAENDACYRAAQALLENQKRDQEMEEEVETKVKERKEPAKLIARRQKVVKEAKRKEFREQQKAKMIAEAELDDTDMADASDNENQEEQDVDETSGKMNSEQDGEEARNEALVQWISTTGLIQLGLEIFTNLISTWISTQFGSGDVQMEGSVNPRVTKIFRTIQQQGMAIRLAETLHTLSEFLRSCEAAPDDPIRDDGEETIGTVSACVVNCFLSGIVLDQSGGNSTQAANELLLWETAMNDLRFELNQGSPSKAVLNACSSILAVAVEMNPGILRSSGGGDSIVMFQKLLPEADGVCLLCPVVLMEAESGANASETETTVRSLTEGYLQLLRQSPEQVTLKTQFLVLKTFMDWYGNDNFYPQLYEVLHVSEGIAASLALLAGNRKDLELDEEQLQILHNSERFLEYKKQLKLQQGR